MLPSIASLHKTALSSLATFVTVIYGSVVRDGKRVPEHSKSDVQFPQKNVVEKCRLTAYKQAHNTQVVALRFKRVLIHSEKVLSVDATLIIQNQFDVILAIGDA